MFLSELKWLWLVAGKRYLQCDVLGEVGVLDKNVGLTVGEWGWGELHGNNITHFIRGGSQYDLPTHQIFQDNFFFRKTWCVYYFVTSVIATRSSDVWCEFHTWL